MNDDQLNQDEVKEIFQNLKVDSDIPNEDNNMNSETATLVIDNYINHPKPLNNGNIFDLIDELNSRQEPNFVGNMNASLITDDKKDGLPINENNESEINFLILSSLASTIP